MGFTESDPAGQAQVNAFRQQLRRFGWIEGINIDIDYRYPADDPSRIRAAAVELLGLAPDLIVSSTNMVTAILKWEVRAVPLVFLYVSDPIGSGFVTNLARPTGNVTGFANFEPSMGGKWLETLEEIAPFIERVGFILNPETPPNVGFLQTAAIARRRVLGERWG
ncbi:MAG: ABC transporter substrate binding protein [Xanthobacteraceae bacterium]